MASSETVYEGIVKLRAETAQLRTDMTQATTLVKTEMQSMTGYASTLGKSLLPAFGAAAVASVITNFAKSILDTAGQVKDLNAQTDISTELLSGLKSTLEENGSSLEAFARAAFTAQKNLGGIDEESDNAARAFEEIGLSVSELKDAKPDKFIETVAKALTNITDPSERAAKGAAIFGRAWREIAPAMEEAADNMERLKASGMSEADINALDVLGDSVVRLKNRLQVDGSMILSWMGKLIQAFGVVPEHIETPEEKSAKRTGEEALKKDAVEALVKAQTAARKSATDLTAVYKELAQAGMTPLNKSIDDITQHYAALAVTGAASLKGQEGAAAALNKELIGTRDNLIAIAKQQAINALQATGAGAVGKFEQQFNVKFDSSKKAVAQESAALFASIANEFKNNPGAQKTIEEAFRTFVGDAIKAGTPDIPELLKSVGLTDLTDLKLSLGTGDLIQGLQQSEKAGAQWGDTFKKETIAMQEQFGNIGKAVGLVKKDLDGLRDAAAQNLIVAMDTSGAEAGLSRLQVQLEIMRSQVAALNATPVSLVY